MQVPIEFKPAILQNSVSPNQSTLYHPPHCVCTYVIRWNSLRWWFVPFPGGEPSPLSHVVEMCCRSFVLLHTRMTDDGIEHKMFYVVYIWTTHSAINWSSLSASMSINNTARGMKNSQQCCPDHNVLITPRSRAIPRTKRCPFSNWLMIDAVASEKLLFAAGKGKFHTFHAGWRFSSPSSGR